MGIFPGLYSVVRDHCLCCRLGRFGNRRAGTKQNLGLSYLHRCFGLLPRTICFDLPGAEGDLEKLPEFRYLFDLLTAYLGSFVVAAMVHFIKPL